MADEFGQDQHDQQQAPAVSQGDVTIKASAIEPQPAQEKKPDLPPYHTEETHEIAKDRAEELKGQNKEYTYASNGYEVAEEDAAEGVTTENGKVYVVTADNFEKTFTTKRAAEIYVETHAEAHKDQPPTISKA